MRGESYAEKVGDITITCTGGTALPANSTVPSINLTVFLNTQVTSRTYANTGTARGSEALLLIDEPGSFLPGSTNTQLACNDPNGFCAVLSTGGARTTFDGNAGHPNIFPGIVSGNSVTFYGIPIEPPATTGLTRTLRITNIRANAATLNAGPNTFVPVTASIATSNLFVTGSTLTVGFVVGSGVTFSVRTPDNSGPGSGPLTIPCSTTTQRLGVLRFGENFGTSFATRTAAAFADGNTSPLPSVQNVPGSISNSESGFYNPNLTAPTVDFATVGLADAGTRFRATFNNVPVGTKVYVSANGVTYANGNPTAATTGSVARLIQNEALPFAPLAPTTTLEGVPAVQLLVTNGSATAIWEVLGTNPAAIENFDFVLWVQVSGTVPVTSSVNGSFAPAPPAFTPVAGSSASSTLPLPRFVADPNAAQYLFTAAVFASVTRPVLTAGTPTFGNPLTFSATASSLCQTLPTSDSITFLDGTTSIGTGNLNASGVASVTTSLLSAGSHSIAAQFNGDSNFGLLTSGALALTVASPPANATVSSPSVAAGGTVSFGTLVIVSANFIATSQSSNSPNFRALAARRISARIASPPSATATFTDNASSASCQAPIVSGTASCSLSFVSAGAHTISVTADNSYTVAGVSTLTFTVAKAVTSTTLAASTNAALTGQNVTLTATLNAGDATAGGTVGFTNGGTPIAGCGAVPLTGVTAKCVVSFQAAGSLSLAATYSGDSNTTASSGTILVTISNPNSPDTSLAITVSQNPATVGQPVTFTASVGATSEGSQGIPTGSVQFSDGGTSLGTVVLANRQARITTTFTTAGSHSIFASYGGDSSFTGSANTFGIAVLRAAASVTLTANPNAGVFGQAVTLTAVLGTVGSAGVPAPSGQIQFFDGSALLGAAAVGTGTAALTVSNLIPGAHQLKAVYSGDTSWSSATSGAVTQTVSKAPTAITLTASSGATQATLNSGVTSISSISSAAAVPSGSVQYMDSGTNGVLATATLAGGSATASVDSAGRMIVAVYSGDANFLGSSSTPAAQLWIGNGASFGSSGFAPNEIVSLMGPNLAASTVSASLPLPVSLGGATVSVTDSAGVTHPATLSYVSPGQINFVLPGNLPSGPATVTVTHQDGTALSITITVGTLAPGIFTASANGKGPAQSLVLDVPSTGESTLTTSNSIGLNSTDTFYLELFGTGLDSANANQVTVSINGQSIPVLFAGAQQQYPGLDQINVGPLPASLKSAGTVNVEVSVNGQSANTVTLTLQ